MRRALVGLGCFFFKKKGEGVVGPNYSSRVVIPHKNEGLIFEHIFSKAPTVLWRIRSQGKKKKRQLGLDKGQRRRGTR